MEYGIIGTLILALNIYGIFQVLTSGTSALAKIIWTVVILALPVLGLLVWFVAGPKGRSVAY